MLSPGLFGAAKRIGSSLFTSVSSSAPTGISTSLIAARSTVVGSGMGGGMGNVGPLMFVRGMAKKKGGRVKDRRIRMIRYSLNHPIMPRPLKFGTMRMLRHWTIHRAWLLYQRKVRRAREIELERQWNSMREACEELSRVDPRLYRIATSKKAVGYFPIEMRIPTDTPPRDGWNHGWVRPHSKA